jgi:hypothetical protein
MLRIQSSSAYSRTVIEGDKHLDYFKHIEFVFFPPRFLSSMLSVVKNEPV